MTNAPGQTLVADMSSTTPNIAEQLCKLNDVLFSFLPLETRRILGMVSTELRAAVRTTIELQVHISDITLPNAFFLATLPSLRLVHIHPGDVACEAVDVAALRRHCKPGEVSVVPSGCSTPLALLYGAMLASAADGELLLTDGRRIARRALRTSRVIRLRGDRCVAGLTDADVACLLGTLAHNRVLEELDLCANAAPTVTNLCLLRAMADALSRPPSSPACDNDRRETRVRHHRALQLPGCGCRVRPAVRLDRPSLPDWMALWSDGEDGDYVRPLTMPLTAAPAE